MFLPRTGPVRMRLSIILLLTAVSAPLTAQQVSDRFPTRSNDELNPVLASERRSAFSARRAGGMSDGTREGSFALSALGGAAGGILGGLVGLGVGGHAGLAVPSQSLLEAVIAGSVAGATGGAVLGDDLAGGSPAVVGATMGALAGMGIGALSIYAICDRAFCQGPHPTLLAIPILEGIGAALGARWGQQSVRPQAGHLP